MTARPTTPTSPPTPDGQSLAAMPCYTSSCGRVTLYHGDSEEMLPHLKGFNAVISDPPYGIGWNTDYTRFSSGFDVPRTNHKRVANDEKPFDPRPWMLKMPVVLFGANCFTTHLPVGSWLVELARRCFKENAPGLPPAANNQKGLAK